MARSTRSLDEFPELIRNANATGTPFPRELTVVDLLDAAAREHPGRPALRGRDGVLMTHEQLRADSVRLAGMLAGQGIGRGSPVGVLLEHESASVSAIIAVVRAGGYYVPLDRRWSVPRTVDVLTSLGVSVLIVSPTLARRAVEIAPLMPDLTIVIRTDGAPDPAEDATEDVAVGAVAEVWDDITSAADDREAAGFNLDRRGYRYTSAQVADYAGHVAGLVLDRRCPGTVVEIGAGSGLVAREIARAGAPVLALDAAADAMTRLSGIAARDGLPIRAVACAAHQASSLLRELDQVGAVLLASTVQYFPSLGYLRTVLHTLLDTLPEGTPVVLADLIDPASGQFPDGLRIPPAWWTDWCAGYPGLAVRLLPRQDTDLLDSPLRHRYDVAFTVPGVVPLRGPQPARGSAERPWCWAELAEDTAPPQAPTAGDLAYTITTSGSTGTPKAVAMRHRSVANLVDWFNRRNAVTTSDVLLQVSAFTFDLSVYDVFGVLAAGGSLLLVPDQDLAEPDRVLDALLGHGVTLWNSAPAALSVLLPLLPARAATGRDTLRRVFLSGDWVPLSTPADLAREFPTAQLVALGGATEACVWSNDFVVTDVDPEWTSIPYGHPMQNARYYVLRADGSPCAVGEPGELHIAGECVAAGYLNDPELTSARFLPDPWTADPAERMYRTGDRARWTSAGWVEFLGRLDHQVKVRGFRIELGEIEQVAQRLPGVREAVAVAVGPTREPEIGVAARAVGLTVPDLREHLRAHLPAYIVPSRLRVVDALPVSPTGKVDRRAVADLLLAQPNEADRSRDPDEAPPTGQLLLLCQVFADSLGLPEVHPDDDFFEIGGNSLRAVRLTARLRQRHGLTIAGTDIFEQPTPRGLHLMLAANTTTGSAANDEGTRTSHAPEQL